MWLLFFHYIPIWISGMTQEMCLFPQLKWKQCIFLFLLGGAALQEDDLGGAAFLGKRLNYSMGPECVF